jgi:cytochrome P450
VSNPLNSADFTLTSNPGEDCYAEPLKFIPERWTTRPELVKNPSAFIPFQNGSNNQCLGMNLAKMEIRLAVARLVSRFDFGFAPGETGKDIHKKMLDLFTTTPGPLQLVFTERDVMS